MMTPEPILDIVRGLSTVRITPAAAPLPTLASASQQVSLTACANVVHTSGNGLPRLASQHVHCSVAPLISQLRSVPAMAPFAGRLLRDRAEPGAHAVGGVLRQQVRALPRRGHHHLPAVLRHQVSQAAASTAQDKGPRLARCAGRHVRFHALSSDPFCKLATPYMSGADDRLGFEAACMATLCKSSAHSGLAASASGQAEQTILGCPCAHGCCLVLALRMQRPVERHPAESFRHLLCRNILELPQQPTVPVPWARRYPCIYCGPPSKYDYTMDEPDDELEAYTVLDNFKAAMANKCAAVNGNGTIRNVHSNPRPEPSY